MSMAAALAPFPSPPRTHRLQNIPDRPVRSNSDDSGLGQKHGPPSLLGDDAYRNGDRDGAASTASTGSEAGTAARGRPAIAPTATPSPPPQPQTGDSAARRPFRRLYSSSRSEQELQRPARERLQALLSATTPASSAASTEGATGGSSNGSEADADTSRPLVSRGAVSLGAMPTTPPRRAAAMDSTVVGSSGGGPSTATHTPSQSVDTPSTPSSPSALLAAAGGNPEVAIRRLLELQRKHLHRIDQLWGFADKQRTMIHDLKMDLERAALDNSRYRARVRELESRAARPLVEAVRDKPAETTAERVQTGETAKTKAEPAVDTQSTPESDQSAFEQATDGSRNSTPRTEPPQEAAREASPQPKPITPQLLLRIDPNAGVNPPAAESLNTTSVTPISPLITSPGGTNKKKAPPTPLKLGGGGLQGPFLGSVLAEHPNEDNASSEDERGRRRTRRDDDDFGGYLVEQERRSRSAKKAKAPVPGQGQGLAVGASSGQASGPASVAPILGLPTSPKPAVAGPGPLESLGSIASALQPQPQPQAQFAALKSPGLPMSPRPEPRPAGGSSTITSGLPPAPNATGNNIWHLTPPLMSPGPMSARGGILSPRPPRQPLPAPVPLSVNAHLAGPGGPQHLPLQSHSKVERRPETEAPPESPLPTGPNSALSGEVYRGLASPDYPNLLLSPAALASVEVLVDSSRLRPSRNSMYGAKVADDDLVFTLAVVAQEDKAQLWRTEKTLHALNSLEAAVHKTSAKAVKLPDKSLFSGHAPAKVDHRRQALNSYFAALLGAPLDDAARMTVCAFLSADAVGAKLDAAAQDDPSALPKKQGYLAKKGKQLGGWKARYFVLNGQSLQYYESPHGQSMGAIRLLHAKIGTQDVDFANDDNEYRHAFMILERRKDESVALLRHILCAESDAERDDWMTALKPYVDAPAPASRPRVTIQTGPAAAAASDASLAVTSSPVTPSGSPLDTRETAPAERPTISGPVAGGPIQDAAAWGNKKEKRGLFGFRSRSSEDMLPARPATGTSANHAARAGLAVFGMPLGDAAELCPPQGVDICLPAPVYRCIEYLEACNATAEQGLFRQSGSQTVITGLKERFNRDADVNLLDGTVYDVHAVASLLKMYLRELPESVLTRAMHLDFVKVLEVRSLPERIAGLSILVHRLPEANYELLATVFRYLVEVARNVDRNLMGVKNLSLIWTAALTVPAPLIDHFINDHEAVFETLADEGAAPVIAQLAAAAAAASATTPTSASSAAPSPGGFDDLRSPRKQMFTDLATPLPGKTQFGGDAAGIAGPSGNSHDTATTAAHQQLPQISSTYRGVTIQQPPTQPAPQSFPPGANEQGFGSLNAALAPPSLKDLKKSRRESSVRGLPISGPLQLQPQSPPQMVTPGLLSPGLPGLPGSPAPHQPQPQLQPQPQPTTEGHRRRSFMPILRERS